LLYGEADPFESHSETANAGDACLLRIFPACVRDACLGPDYAPSEAELIVLQAVLNQGLETAVVLADFVHFLALQMAALHARAQMKRYTHRLAVLAEKSANPDRPL
jgi:hypothetical protein